MKSQSSTTTLEFDDYIPTTSNTTTTIKDVLTKYRNFKMDNEKSREKSPLEYWKNLSLSQCLVEQNLAKIAKKYLTPPPTSVDVERLFSTAGNILTDKRNRIRPENLQQLVFLRENLPRINFQY